MNVLGVTVALLVPTQYVRVRILGGVLKKKMKWGARPTGRHLFCIQKIGVRFPGAPLEVAFDRAKGDYKTWKVAGYGLPGRIANA